MDINTSPALSPPPTSSPPGDSPPPPMHRRFSFLKQGNDFANFKGIKLLIPLLLLGLFAITFLAARERQEIRKKASGTGVSLMLIPANITASAGQEFTVAISINTKDLTVSAAELHLTYDPAKLQAEQIQIGSFLPVELVPGAVGGGNASITVGAIPTAPKKGTDVLASLKLKALTDGASDINFASTTQVAAIGQTSNVVDTTTGAHIVVGNITSTPTNTPTPTTTQSDEPTATPTPTPQQGATPTPTLTPTSTPTPTPQTVPLGCNRTCVENRDCISTLFCYNGLCRNASCISQTNCICVTPTPTPTKVSKKPTVAYLSPTSVLTPTPTGGFGTKYSLVPSSEALLPEVSSTPTPTPPLQPLPIRFFQSIFSIVSNFFCSFFPFCK